MASASSRVNPPPFSSLRTLAVNLFYFCHNFILWWTVLPFDFLFTPLPIQTHTHTHTERERERERDTDEILY